ncbi:hypothetical protein CC86DRAFT_413679 [Ophiobolus disseminans]|uniref:F-box domain-containing protein n=1 Tax=Ophiobolus disseminans TaxID=1469910 RepID=A0A6A6ZCF7_9PLEO|nr:hypothetical protein CC86DRAFT_413679 [Ophiobolus disseminans]
MDNLPNELQSMIASYLPTEDVRNFCLASQRQAAHDLLEHAAYNWYLRALVYEEEAPIDSTASSPRDEVERLGIDVCDDVVQDFLGAGCMITELVFHITQHFSFISRRAASPGGEARMSQLTRLSISVYADESGEDLSRPVFESGQLCAFILSFGNLQHLHLSVPPDGETYAVLILDLQLEGMLPLSFHENLSLTSLKVEDLVAKEDELVRVLAAHKSTLKSLHLRHIHLSQGGTWRNVLRRLRALLQLDAAELKSLYWWRDSPDNGGGMNEKAERYLWDDQPNDAVGRVDDDLCKRMQEYLVYGGQSPFEW